MHFPNIIAMLSRPNVKAVTLPGVKVYHAAKGDGTLYVKHHCGETCTDRHDVNEWGGVDAPYYGKITPSGEFLPNFKALPGHLVTDTLVDIEDGGAMWLAEVGKACGYCCFCARTLTTTESLAVGYGPVCADKHGLPWGLVAA